MPFRLDDVLHMDWARENSLWDAFSVDRGEIVRSVRPIFAVTIWLLNKYAGINNYFPWHFVLVSSFLIGLTFAGKTARYIAQRDSALYFTTGFFWLAFLPILNVLFWYGDLTFTIELLFVTPAWYFGLRGLLEGNLKLWLVGILSGTFAVLTKEPALLLVHLIFVGVGVLRFSEIRTTWDNFKSRRSLIAVVAYLVFFAISVKIYLASPTKSNRFFNVSALSGEQFHFLIADRLSYYGETLLNPIGRVLLATPIVYFLSRCFGKKDRGIVVCILEIVGCAVFSFLAVKSLPVFSAILLAAPIFGYFKRNKKQSAILLPFALSAILIMLVLLITVMIVKTQLTELSFVLLVISGVYWAELADEMKINLATLFHKKAIVVTASCLLILALAGSVFALLPILQSKEKLLSTVRDSRSNANDGIKWMGKNLPTNSTLLVTGHSLYGLGSADDLTSKEDEYKSFVQYTFIQGYIRSYLHALDRYDVGLSYITDSVLLSRVLDSCRSAGTYYVFLQTGMDVARFHGSINGIKQLKSTDTLVARFAKGPYPSEVWKLAR